MATAMVVLARSVNVANLAAEPIPRVRRLCFTAESARFASDFEQFRL